MESSTNRRPPLFRSLRSIRGGMLPPPDKHQKHRTHKERPLFRKTATSRFSACFEESILAARAVGDGIPPPPSFCRNADRTAHRGCRGAHTRGGGSEWSRSFPTRGCQEQPPPLQPRLPPPVAAEGGSTKNLRSLCTVCSSKETQVSYRVVRGERGWQNRLGKLER